MSQAKLGLTGKTSGRGSPSAKTPAARRRTGARSVINLTEAQLQKYGIDKRQFRDKCQDLEQMIKFLHENDRKLAKNNDTQYPLLKTEPNGQQVEVLITPQLLEGTYKAIIEIVSLDLPRYFTASTARGRRAQVIVDPSTIPIEGLKGPEIAAALQQYQQVGGNIETLTNEPVNPSVAWLLQAQKDLKNGLNSPVWVDSEFLLFLLKAIGGNESTFPDITTAKGSDGRSYALVSKRLVNQLINFYADARRLYLNSTKNRTDANAMGVVPNSLEAEYLAKHDVIGMDQDLKNLLGPTRVKVVATPAKERKQVREKKTIRTNVRDIGPITPDNFWLRSAANIGRVFMRSLARPTGDSKVPGIGAPLYQVTSEGFLADADYDKKEEKQAKEDLIVLNPQLTWQIFSDLLKINRELSAWKDNKYDAAYEQQAKRLTKLLKDQGKIKTSLRGGGRTKSICDSYRYLVIGPPGQQPQSQLLQGCSATGPTIAATGPALGNIQQLASQLASGSIPIQSNIQPVAPMVANSAIGATGNAGLLK